MCSTSYVASFRLRLIYGLENQIVKVKLYFCEVDSRGSVSGTAQKYPARRGGSVRLTRYGDERIK